MALDLGLNVMRDKSVWFYAAVVPCVCDVKFLRPLVLDYLATGFLLSNDHPDPHTPA